MLQHNNTFKIELCCKILADILFLHFICTVMMVSSPIYYHVPQSIIILPWLWLCSRSFTIPQTCQARATCWVGSWLLEAHQLRRCDNCQTRLNSTSWDWHSCLPMSCIAVELTFLSYSLTATHSTLSFQLWRPSCCRKGNSADTVPLLLVQLAAVIVSEGRQTSLRR